MPSDWLARLKVLQAQGDAAVRELPAGLLGSLEGGEDAPLDYSRVKASLPERGGCRALLKQLLMSSTGSWSLLFHKRP